MDQLLDPDLVPTDVIRSYSFSTQYQALIDDLAALGFRESDRTLLVFPYDWRKPNEHAAGKLADLLDTVPPAARPGRRGQHRRPQHGRADRPLLPGVRPVRRPARVRPRLPAGHPRHPAPRCAPRPVPHSRPREAPLAQRRADPQAANDPRYPTPYQFLPPPAEVFAWDADPNAELAGLDPYSPEVGKALGLVRESVEAARTFHATLDPAGRPAAVRYFCFSGSQMATAAFAKVTRDGAGYSIRKVDREDSGDGTVPF